jgi:hypothetical protein
MVVVRKIAGLQLRCLPGGIEALRAGAKGKILILGHFYITLKLEVAFGLTHEYTYANFQVP